MQEAFSFSIGEHHFDRPIVMGILNTTPDSFSDGGRYAKLDAALRQVERMLDEGVTIIDVGGESTRPGAQPVSLELELSRTITIIEAVRQRFDCLISIDTYKSEVMRQAVAAGANMINDVCALTKEGALDAAAELQVPVCLMHMQGQPQTMQNKPNYIDVINEVYTYMCERISACEKAGLARSQLILDPGFGFGKTLEQNYQLLANFSHFQALGLPLLAGMSRKSMFGQLLQREPQDRLAASLAGALLAAQQGAAIIRVHDVAATNDVLKVLEQVNKGKR